MPRCAAENCSAIAVLQPNLLCCGNTGDPLCEHHKQYVEDLADLSVRAGNAMLCRECGHDPVAWEWEHV